MYSNIVNSRSICLIGPSLSNPDKLMTVSPSSLWGPSKSSWTSLGAGGDYWGQQAAQLTWFRKYWKLYYAKWLCSNHQMAEQSTLFIQDIVLIVDLADNSGRSNPNTALGCVEGFLDPDTRSQVIVKYHQGTVNRPTGKLVRLVKKVRTSTYRLSIWPHGYHRQINPKGSTRKRLRWSQKK